MDQASTRERIVGEADRLFYEQGFDHTSFADIADAVRISRGNFYHHFKTKDDILGAVIVKRLAKTEAMLRAWEADGTGPEARLQSFIEILLVNKTAIMKFGCPVGTLCGELAKLNHDAQDDAGAIFTLFRNWLRRQFVLAGHEAEADAWAMHLLARSQGVATMANAFRDDDFVRAEVDLMKVWLRSVLTGAPSSGGPPKHSSSNT